MFHCNNCGRKFKHLTSYKKHVDKCSENFPISEFGKTWIKCAICGFIAKSLGKHVGVIHSVTSKEYVKAYPGSLLNCEESAKNYSDQNRKNGGWIERKKTTGDDLSEYRKKMGDSVSKSIMSNDDERKRRSVQMQVNNQTPEARKRSSDTAKITSSRQEVLAIRTENLRQWRFKHPEEFEKVVMKMLSTHISRPEKELYKILVNYNFRRQVMIQHPDCPNASKKMRVDIGCLERKILIEFDGPFHFKQIRGVEHLEHRRKRDKTAEIYAIENNFTLIRISCDQYVKGCFLDACILKLFELLENQSPGVYYLGKEYLKLGKDVS